ncbi:hypothetical protein ACLMJK_001783 [Lecanora helva]
MARPSRTALHANDPTYLWKAILRTLTILFAVVGIATVAWALNNQAPYYTAVGYDDGDGDYYDTYYTFTSLPWLFITFSLSIIWNLTNLAVLFSRNKAIHPGANVGCDLVLWLGFIVTGIMVSARASDFLFYASYGRHDNRLRHIGIVIAVAAAMNCSVLLLHFILFVSACRYTHARRYGAGSKHAKAVITEATKLAQQMIADMTGPNGSFRPRTPPPPQQQQQQQPQMTSQLGRDNPGGLRQPNNAVSNQHSRQISARSSILHLPPPDEEPPEIKVQGPGGTHPALRFEQDVNLGGRAF